MRVGAPRVGGRLAGLAGGSAVAVGLLVLLLGARDARAAELVYFANDPLQGQIAVLDAGSGSASPLDTAGAVIDAPEGLSYDPVTNRLYVASQGVSADGNIAYVNLGGGGGAPMPLPPLLLPAVKDPRAVVVDPVGRIAYWLNNTVFGPAESILWARLDGSEGGELPLGGQPLLLGAEALAVDPASGRLYWGNADGSIHYAPLVGSSGAAGELEAKSNGGGANFLGIAVDSGSARIFWDEYGSGSVWQAGLGGTTKNEVVSGSAAVNLPDGLAYDPDKNRLYWANSGVEESTRGALGFATPESPASEITPTGVPVNHPQEVLVIKSPTATGAPQLSLVNGRLQCSQGSWGSDHASSFVYQSPRSFSYGWTRNGTTIPGASEAGYAPTESGTYACVVTATNQAGSTPRTSGLLKVTVAARPKPVTATTKPVSKSKSQGKRAPANLTLAGAGSRHLRARPGKLLILPVRASNQGNVASISSQVCLKLAQRAKRALRPGKCRQLGPLVGGGSATAKLRLRVKRSAQPGIYRLRIAVPGDQTKVTVRVLG